MAVGMHRILKKKGLVKKLMATETLGRTDVLCVDKTGTLTEGKMDITDIFTLKQKFEISNLKNREENHSQSYNLPKEISAASTICNEAFLEDKNYKGSPTDIALLKLGKIFGFTKKALKKKHDIAFIPFSKQTNTSSAIFRNLESDIFSASLIAEDEDINKQSLGAESVQYFCGSPEQIIENSEFQIDPKEGTTKLNAKQRQKLLEKETSLAQKGYRLLGVGKRKLSQKAKKKIFSKDVNTVYEAVAQVDLDELTFLGLIAISDPLRKSAPATVLRVKKSGLRLAIITGDHAQTASNIAQKIGLPNQDKNIMTGQELSEIPDSELESVLEDIYIFARISPEDKVRIIKAWQKKDKIVAMTGDGVNDAPALNLADIGIALGSGTDVAKDSADIVLLDNNLETIVETIKEGRGILDNIKKVVTYLLSDTFSEMAIVTTAIVFGLPLPIIPAQILWINLVEDGLPDAALALEPTEKNIMNIKPKFFQKKILDKEVKTISFFIGWIHNFALIGLFIYYYLNGYDVAFARTMVFATLAMDSLIFAFSCKSLRKPLWKIDILSNHLLNISFVLGIVLLIASIYVPFLQNILQTVPLNGKYWILITIVSFIDIVCLEMVKLFFIKTGFFQTNREEG
jgi:Ca2+-transporting ATPase